MPQNSIKKFYENNLEEFEKWTNNEAREMIRKTWLFILPIGIISYLNYKIVPNNVMLFAYCPAILVSIIALFLDYKSLLRIQHPIFWTDCMFCLLGLGGGLVISGAIGSGERGVPILTNAPAQIILIVTGFFCFRLTMKGQIVRILFIAMCLILPPLMLGYEARLFNAEFIVQLVIGIAGAAFGAIYMLEARQHRFVAEMIFKRELDTKEAQIRKKIAEVKHESLQKRIDSMIAIADRLNSPFTTIKTVTETITTKVADLKEIVEKNSSKNQDYLSFLKIITAVQLRLGVLSLTSEEIQQLADEINEFRNSDHHIDNTKISLKESLSSSVRE